ncbi:MAG: CFI-box-CTERM domain-containing protein, partial [Planctomycetota bacterium]
DIGDEPGEMLEAGKGYWLRNILGQDVILSFAPAGLGSVSAANSPNFPSQDFFVRVAQQESPPDPPPGVESSSSLSFSGGSASGGCFITTAAYRDYDHPNVQLLRKFRDQYFLTNSFGRIFVDIYYRYSSTLAKFVAGHSSMKALVRFNLMPIVGLSSLFIKMNVYGFLVVFAFPIIMCFLLLGRSGGGGGRCKPKFSINSEEAKGER